MTNAAFISPKSGNLILPKARMMYASLFEPAFPSKSERDEKKKAWQITGMFAADAVLTECTAEYNRLVGDNLPPAQVGKTKVKSPILKTADIASMAAHADEYPVSIRMNAKQFMSDGRRRQQPEVIKRDMSPCIADEEADEIYNGRWFRASVRPYFWSDNAGGKGVSFGLVNVQLLEHDEPLEGGKAKASSDFEAVAEGLGDLE